MKPSMLVLIFVFNFALLGAGICPVLAKAPTTAKIVFGASREGNRDLYLMNIDGSEQINITNHPADDIYGAWSPTGEQILFVSDRDKGYDLYLMDADGQKRGDRCLENLLIGRLQHGLRIANRLLTYVGISESSSFTSPQAR